MKALNISLRAAVGALACCVSVQASGQPEPLVTYSATDSYPYMETSNVQITAHMVQGVPVYWLKKRDHHNTKPATADVVLYADSNACPAVIERLRALRAIELPSVPFPDEITPGHAGMAFFTNTVRDGTDYVIEIRGQFVKEHAAGEFHINGNFDSPVATWVNATEEALKPCWSKQPN